MRNIFFTILVALGFAQMTSAQSPNSFSYQAVVRDASGNTTNNQSVAFRISILKTTATGTSVYSETHTATTNDFGLVNLEIGGGTAASGNFGTINWGTDDYFVKVELDAAGGTNYLTMGTSQLLSVPFAMYAKTSGDKVWAKAGNNAQLTNGAVGIGTTATGYALTLKAIGSNALIKGNNVSGQTLLNINTAGGHPFLKLNNNTGSVEKISLNTNGNSFFNGGDFGVGTNNPMTKFHVNQSATNGGEEVARFQVSDAPNDLFQILNATGTSGQFIPNLYGLRTSDNREVIFLTGTTSAARDNGINPVVAFDGRRDNGPLVTRPLFQWRNYGNSLMTMAANGNLGLGTTTPARKLHVSDAMRLEPLSSAPSNPSKGDMYFNGTSNKLMVYDGTTWQACW